MPTDMTTPTFNTRLKAALIHLGLSCVVALLASAVIFLLWFPSPYHLVAGGLELFLLIVSCDVVLGPLLTLVAFNVSKPRKELMRDIGIIAAVQLAALCFGVWTMFGARPVFMVHNVDRFSVVTAADLDEADLAQATKEEYKTRSLTGPRLVGTRLPSTGDEQLKLVESAIGGKDIHLLPKYYRRYDESRQDVLRRAKRVDELRRRFPLLQMQIDDALKQHGLSSDQALFLPVLARMNVWTAIIDPNTLQPVAFLPIDSF